MRTNPTTALIRHLCVALAICLSFAHSTLAGTPRTLTATITRVADGDTVSALTASGTKLRVRLLGIDAPEIAHGDNPGQPFGEEARQYLAHLIGGKTVQVEAHGPDRYKRVLAVVFDDQVNVNLLLAGSRGPGRDRGIAGYPPRWLGPAGQQGCQRVPAAMASEARLALAWRLSPSAFRHLTLPAQ
jgi:hypothetical protein